MNLDGEDLKNLTNNPQEDTHPHFSSDGEYIIFDSFRDGNGEIYSMNKMGDEQVNFTNTPIQDEWNVQYSYDGTKIMYMVGAEYPNDIWIMDSDGDNKVNLTNSPFNEKLPQFSFDGTKIAFLTETHLDTLGNLYIANELHVLDLKTNKRTNLGQVSGDEFIPRFSPNGSKILCVSTINISIASSSSLCLIDLNDKSVTILTSEFDLYGEPAFTINGSEIVFVKGNGDFEIFRSNPHGNAAMNLSKSSHWDRWFDISSSIQRK